MMMDERSRNERESSEERKLELRLGPPGSEDWRKSNIGGGGGGERDEHDESLLSLGYFSTMLLNNAKNIPSSPWSSSTSSCYNNNNNNSGGVGEKKSSVFSPPNSSPSSATNTAVPNTSQKRTAPGPVVGWPPIRSFRKNLANSNSSSKLQTTDSPQQQHNKVVGKKHVDNNNNYGTSSSSKGLFVKINMDGVPIGRKVDLNAYDTYENLSSAVDDLFRGLLAAQRDSSNKKKQEEEKAITGLLDGSGEYTLVYEDNEGDRMLVGDVPWHMFVSTVKRLRVLKSSELSAFTHGTKQDKIST